MMKIEFGKSFFVCFVIVLYVLVRFSCTLIFLFGLGLLSCFVSECWKRFFILI